MTSSLVAGTSSEDSGATIAPMDHQAGEAGLPAGDGSKPDSPSLPAVDSASTSESTSEHDTGSGAESTGRSDVAERAGSKTTFGSPEDHGGGDTPTEEHHKDHSGGDNPTDKYPEGYMEAYLNSDCLTYEEYIDKHVPSTERKPSSPPQQKPLTKMQREGKQIDRWFHKQYPDYDESKVTIPADWKTFIANCERIIDADWKNILASNPPTKRKRDDDEDDDKDHPAAKCPSCTEAR